MKNMRYFWGLPLLAVAFCAAAPTVRTVQFERFGSYFTRTAHVAFAVDPQVFIEDPNAPAAPAEEAIPHVQGFRAARLDDASDNALFAADGAALDLSLERWLAASGTARILSAPDGHDRVTLSFRNLVAFGTYSVFLERFGADAALLPLDGSGEGNSFTASVDGNSTLTITAPGRLAPGNVIVLIYHADDMEHGTAPGQIALDAFQQLIAKI